MSYEEANPQTTSSLLQKGIILSLNNVGKRYNREWIFRNLSYEFQTGTRYAITGSNGSGKSTLLQVIGGALMHNEGAIRYRETQIKYQDISIAAPYLELVEE